MTLVYVYGSGECEQLGEFIIWLKCKHANQNWRSPLTYKRQLNTFLTFVYPIGLGDDFLESKKARKPAIFDVGNAIPARSIVKIICGGMHTVALASNGSVYSWGCNDEGAIGRTGPENTPLQVDSALNIPITDIAGGDSHTIAYNTHTN
jgi:hypothetical protein